MSENSKKCSGPCGLVKPLIKFHVDNKAKSGYQCRCKVCQSKHAKGNKEAINARRRERYKEDPTRRRREALAYKKKYRDKDNFLGNRRRAAKIQRTVSWADDWKIQQFYTMAQKLSKLYGVKFVVDHVIPLRGKLVSGLHIETNLQIITESENCKKSNKFIPG